MFIKTWVLLPDRDASTDDGALVRGELSAPFTPGTLGAGFPLIASPVIPARIWSHSVSHALVSLCIAVTLARHLGGSTRAVSEQDPSLCCERDQGKRDKGCENE